MGRVAVIPQDVVPYRRKRYDLTRGFLPSGAKGGAISPRLGNLYSRFPLSHRSCCDGFCKSPKRVQRPESSQVAHPSLFEGWDSTAFSCLGFSPCFETRKSTAPL